MYLSIDFDGTIVEHNYPKIGNPVPHALEWIKKFQELGIKLILNTMRSDNDLLKQYTLSDAVNYLHKNGIKLYGVNGNPDQNSWTSSPKVYANYYIDDAAIGCPLIYPKSANGYRTRPYVDWNAVGNLVLLAIKE